MDSPDKIQVPDPDLQVLLDSGPPRLSKAVDNFLRGGRKAGDTYQNPTFMFYPGLPTKPILDPGNFPWAQTLEENWQQIRDECLQLVRDKSTECVRITASTAQNSVWNTFLFLDEGTENQVNMNKCPITTKLMQNVPLLRGCCLGYCYVSVIFPGTHITAHCGPSNVKYRCHLPLLLPTCPMEELGMRVGDQYVNWTPGKCLLFDDSYQHEVWHKSDQNLPRVVLLFDFWHPDLQEVEKEALFYCLPDEPADRETSR